jgi:hypothetical protein
MTYSGLCHLQSTVAVGSLFYSVLCYYNRVPQTGQLVKTLRDLLPTFWRLRSPRSRTTSEDGLPAMSRHGGLHHMEAREG